MDELRDLDGLWALARVSGALPPLGLLHKRIDGRRGATHWGPVVRVPFRVRVMGDGAELIYRGPLGVWRDTIVPSAGGWTGEARLLGVRVGRFRMTRRA